jgi:hypothetical protein
MLRGAIDHVHHERVGGWIYSGEVNLKGATVLAFVEGRCVGSGVVDKFRQDLADVGLGDGYLGFSFPISLVDKGEKGKVIVKLQDSDAVLLPPGAKISAPSRASLFKSLQHDAASIEWMQGRGWFDNLELAFLKYVSQFGVFEISLINKKEVNGPTTSRVLEAEPIAAQYLDLVSLTKSKIISLSCEAIDSESVVAAVTGALPNVLPVVGILASQPGAISLVEGSHHDAILPNNIDGGVSYKLGPDRLLFVNLLCALSFDESSIGDQLTIYAAAS